VKDAEIDTRIVVAKLSRALTQGALAAALHAPRRFIAFAL
jgi:hypothetical protein